MYFDNLSPPSRWFCVRSTVIFPFLIHNEMFSYKINFVILMEYRRNAWASDCYIKDIPILSVWSLLRIKCRKIYWLKYISQFWIVRNMKCLYLPRNLRSSDSCRSIESLHSRSLKTSIFSSAENNRITVTLSTAKWKL